MLDVEGLRDWCRVPIIDGFPSVVLAGCLDEIDRLRVENAELLRLLGRPSTEGLRLRKEDAE